VPLTLKISGCAALRDLHEARQVGARYISAPMIESRYALQKFIDIIAKTYQAAEIEAVDFLFNLETIQAYQCFDEILKLALASSVITGIVFGRSDFSGSLGIQGEVQNAQVTAALAAIAQRLTPTRLDLVVGGTMSLASLPELRRIARHKLTRFETRKVVFDATSLNDTDLKHSLLDAVHFEILWLINKSEVDGALHQQDRDRIAQLQRRWQLEQNQLMI